ncbi:hypothetical protein FRC03_012360 [Tulasnella sp. 419]|nr:hypothetical protein FRC03_012360 [Tulasnella sp. 419]
MSECRQPRNGSLVKNAGADDAPVFSVKQSEELIDPLNRPYSDILVTGNVVITEIDLCDSSASENGYGWEGYQNEALPEKEQHRYIRNLRFQIFNVYRRLFTIAFVVNLAILISLAVKGNAEVPYLASVVIGNIFVAVLIRQDNVVNGLFCAFTSVPNSWPLSVRTFVARIYSLGGIHSGSSVAATLWLFYFTIRVTEDLIKKKASAPLTGITYTILLLLIVIIALAMPSFRRLKHDYFEMVHRLLGWTVTALVWAEVILLTRDYKDPQKHLHVALRESAPFWLVVILTASIASSWMHLRKVKVTSEVLSDHAIRINFDHKTPAPGTFVRISHSPLTEWHSFATIAAPQKQGYSIIVSRAGDWTSNVIANPPHEVWIRGIPTCGVMTIVPLFRRVVIVATGSGIAPCAPHLFAKRTAIKLLWISRNIAKTYGAAFVDSIMSAAPDSVIYDTDAYGRPNMVQLIHHLYKEFDAEAVCIIANQPITQKVVYGIMTRGVAAFGAIWDS